MIPRSPQGLDHSDGDLAWVQTLLNGSHKETIEAQKAWRSGLSSKLARARCEVCPPSIELEPTSLCTAP